MSSCGLDCFHIQYAVFKLGVRQILICALSVWKGTVQIGEETMPNPTFHTLVLSAEEGQTGVKLTAGEEGAEFVLVNEISAYV